MHTRVIVRADLNIDLNASHQEIPLKIARFQKTYDTLRQKKLLPIIITHLNNQQSTRHLIPFLQQCNIDPVFLAAGEHIADSMLEKTVLMENIRMHPEEKENSYSFARALSHYAHYFVQDAFGTIHRNHSSITQLPRCYGTNNRWLGNTVTLECTNLSKLFTNPQRPFVLILGGGKGTDKIPLIKQLLPLVDTVITTPGISTQFLGVNSLLYRAIATRSDQTSLHLECTEIMNIAQHMNRLILTPTDHIVIRNNTVQTVPNNALLHNDIIAATGPETTSLYQSIIARAQTVLYNGPMGFTKYPETCIPTEQLLKTIGTTSCFSVIAGGDSTTRAQLLGNSHQFSFCSTGGGATLYYVAHQTAPGLIPFEKELKYRTKS